MLEYCETDSSHDSTKLAAEGWRLHTFWRDNFGRLYIWERQKPADGKPAPTPIPGPGRLTTLP